MGFGGINEMQIHAECSNSDFVFLCFTSCHSNILVLHLSKADVNLSQHSGQQFLWEFEIILAHFWIFC